MTERKIISCRSPHCGIVLVKETKIKYEFAEPCDSVYPLVLCERGVNPRIRDETRKQISSRYPMEVNVVFPEY
jgi:hypothetical protein